jgi:predicted RNA binding protein YcfA (HicA-like mRNA interferase family)
VGRGKNGFKAAKLPRITGARVIQALRRAGWQLDYKHGSHVYLRHPNHPHMRVIVPLHVGEIIKPKTLQSILKQADLSVDEFQELL